MKQLLTLIILFSSFIQAQTYQVEYETQVRFVYNENGLDGLKKSQPNVSERNKIIEGNENPPKEYFSFLFNEKEANANYVKKVNNNQGEIARFIMIPPNLSTNYSYYDFKKGTYLEERDLYGRKFLVENSFKSLDFKETGKTKTILGYLTKEAIYSKDNFKIMVWYAPEFKKNYNLDIYTGVDGLVLEEIIIDKSDNGDRIIKIDALEIKKLKKAKIIKPIKGEKVTDKEFIDIMRETNRKRDELYEQSNGIDK